ncbi:unnamed protein product [Parajaminaea phylloscopi]
MRVDTTKAAEVQDQGPAISLNALRLVSEARNQHGLRQHDYERYRQFCTKKTHRLRQTLGLTHKDDQRDQKAPAAGRGKSKKAKRKQTVAAQSAADKAKGGNVFTQKTIDVVSVENDRPAQLLLFETERAWAQSQHLRNQFNEAEDPSLRRRGLARARRAVQWSSELSTLVGALGSRVDPQSRAEVATYGLIIKGSALFDKADWMASLESFAIARQILALLTRCSADSRGEALANSFVDVNDPQMRFCAYQLEVFGEEQDLDVITETVATPEARARICPEFASIAEKLESAAQARSNTKEVKDSVQIEWRGQVIPIRNPELMDAVVRARQAETTLSESSETQRSATTTKHSVRGSKPQRLTHAERTARKRGDAATAGESSASAASRAIARTQSSYDQYDHALAALTDGELIARKIVEDNAEALSRSHSARYEAVGEDLKAAHEWLSYRLMSLQIKRSSRLADEVKLKAEKREKRKQDALSRKIAAQSGQQQKQGRISSRKANKKEGVVPTKAASKPGPGSRAKASPRLGHRRPARSGAKALRARRSTALASRARLLAEAQARRRSARSIPALAKLLDSSEANLVSISSLSIVESDPDASSVIDAKAAWYRAELLRQLARAHTLANQRDEACLLLRRAALSARQARQAFDLVDERDVAAEMDRDIPPALSEETFTKADQSIEDELRRTRRETFRVARIDGAGDDHGKHATRGYASALSLTQSKAGQQLRSLALKHVDFDPLDVEEAARVEPDLRDEFERELRGSKTGRPSKSSTAAAKTSPVRPQAKTAPVEAAHDHSSSEDEAAEQFEEAAEDDTSDHEEFAPAQEQDVSDEEAYEEDEGVATPSTEQKKGWLGGWFGRK